MKQASLTFLLGSGRLDSFNNTSFYNKYGVRMFFGPEDCRVGRLGRTLLDRPQSYYHRHYPPPPIPLPAPPAPVMLEPNIQGRRAGPKRLDRGAGTAAAAAPAAAAATTSTATTLLRGAGPREDKRPQAGEAGQPGDAPPRDPGAPEVQDS